MPRRRTIGDVQSPLTDAEQRLVDSCRRGHDDGGRFEALPKSRGFALILAGADIQGSVSFQEIDLPCVAAAIWSAEFHVSGIVSLVSAHIHGHLHCRRSKFDAYNGESLPLNYATIDGQLRFQGISQPMGRIYLRGAVAGGIFDDIKSWKQADSIVLDGFRYGRFLDSLNYISPTGAHDRIEWLKCQREPA